MSAKTFQYRLIIVLGLVLIRQVEVDQKCYKVTFISVKTTDTKFYKLKATLNEDSSVSSLTTVLKDVPAPMWKFVVIEHGQNTVNTKIHFNGLLETCTLFKSLDRVRLLRQLVTPIFKNPRKGNFTFDCPFRVGAYALNNIIVPPQSGGVMKYLNSPNSLYGISFKVLQRLPNNKMEKLATFELNSTISKIC